MRTAMMGGSDGTGGVDEHQGEAVQISRSVIAIVEMGIAIARFGCGRRGGLAEKKMINECERYALSVL